MKKEWNNLPYYSINNYYKKRFGEKINKISVSISKNCPHRDKDNRNGCIFCNEWGAASVHSNLNKPLMDQIIENKSFIRKRYRVSRFLVYFQSFTSTYMKTDIFESSLNLALNESEVAGLIIGTRPDTISDDIFHVLNNISKQTYLSVELGVQTFLDDGLQFLNRGHTAAQSFEAIERLSKIPNLDIGIHLIFGLPHESQQTISDIADQTNRLPIANVKLHNLHIFGKTRLHNLYQKGLFKPNNLDEYSDKVVTFIERLSPDIAIQRIVGFAGSQTGLVAPGWTADRFKPIQHIQQQMRNRNTYQGKCYQTQ